MGGKIDVSSEKGRSSGGWPTVIDVRYISPLTLSPCASGRGATFRFFIEATLPKESKCDPAGLGIERASAVARRIKALRRANGSQDPRHVGVDILITEDNQVRLLRDSLHHATNKQSNRSTKASSSQYWLCHSCFRPDRLTSSCVPTPA